MFRKLLGGSGSKNNLSNGKYISTSQSEPNYRDKRLSAPAISRDRRHIPDARGVVSLGAVSPGLLYFISDCDNNNYEPGDPAPKILQLESETDYKIYLETAKTFYRDKILESPQGLESFENFNCLQIIGKGGFGQVLLVQDAETNKHYAIKVLNQKFIRDRRLMTNVIREKKNLYAVRNPFIVPLCSHFKDEVNLYLLMEFVDGGDLQYHLNRMGRFTENMARFYAAQVVLAFEYLHNLKLVYRDLKPNNIVINKHGNIKIVDFGLVKRVPDRTDTFVGTPEYLAPEIVIKKKYNKSIDWWTLGIFIYQMICGSTPFHDKNEWTMYANIHQGKVRFNRAFSEDSKDIIKRLLQVDSKLRLGNGENGAEELKSHPWFSSINFIDLFNKTATPPWLPLALPPPPPKKYPTQHIPLDKFFEKESANQENLAHVFKDF